MSAEDPGSRRTVSRYVSRIQQVGGHLHDVRDFHSRASKDIPDVVPNPLRLHRNVVTEDAFAIVANLSGDGKPSSARRYFNGVAVGGYGRRNAVRIVVLVHGSRNLG